MKKVGKVFLVVWAVLATFLLVMACIAYNESKMDSLLAYSILKSEYEELKAENISVADLLPYKLYYDAETHILLGVDHDWEKAVAEAAEEYNLSKAEQAELLKKVEWLITMSTTLAK